MIQRLSPKVTCTSVLAASPGEVWNWVSSFDGVNREMSPLLKMTPPSGSELASASDGEVLPLRLNGPLGVPLGTYPLQLKEIEAGKGFLEQTQMLPFLLWQHERTVRSASGESVITDSLSWRWRARRLDFLVAAGVRCFFEHRHRILRRELGGSTP